MLNCRAVTPTATGRAVRLPCSSAGCALKVIPRLLSCDTGLAEEQHSYLAFSTGGNIGLQILPADGNPHKAATVIGHPAKVGVASDGVDLPGGDD